MATRIQLRRDTSTNWAANNPVLALGEPGLETDTLRVKYGDGSNAWSRLGYTNLDSLNDFTTNDLTEGNNLYFTNARVYANTIASGFVSNTYATNAQLTSFLSSFITVTQLTNYATLAQLQSTTTANVTELTNLYYTNARAYANIIGAGFAPNTFATNAQLATYATNAQLSTYATNAQVASFATNAQLATFATNAQVASFATNAQLATYATNNQLNTYVTMVQLAGTTSGSITESVNLYFTNARSYANVVSLGYASNTFVVNQLSQIYYPAVARLSVTNIGASNYNFYSHYSSNNPNVYTISGTTISFALDVTGHPFLLQENSGSGFNNITSSTQLFHLSPTGVLTTGSSAQGQVAGTLYWNVPFGTTNVYQYRCSIHSNMVGNVIVKDISVI